MAEFIRFCINLNEFSADLVLQIKYCGKFRRFMQPAVFWQSKSFNKFENYLIKYPVLRGL